MKSCQVDTKLIIHTQIFNLNLKKKDKNNPIENNRESLRGETPVEPNTNPTENTLQISLQIPESSFSEIHSGQIQNISVELQQQFSKVFSLEQTEAENESLRLQHQR